jgi:hypothetical protein
VNGIPELPPAPSAVDIPSGAGSHEHLGTRRRRRGAESREQLAPKLASEANSRLDYDRGAVAIPAPRPASDAVPTSRQMARDGRPVGPGIRAADEHLGRLDPARDRLG